MHNSVPTTARRELKRREWASRRGKATRAYLREHPELAKQFDAAVSVDNQEGLPKYVTRASVILELNQRARRREAAVASKQWIKEHPEEAAEIRSRELGTA